MIWHHIQVIDRNYKERSKEILILRILTRFYIFIVLLSIIYFKEKQLSQCK